MFNLPRRLEELLCHHGSMLPKGADEEIPLIKQDLEEIISILHGHILTSTSMPPGLRIDLIFTTIREFSLRIQDALQRHAMYNNLGGVAGTASTTRGDVCSATPWHPTKTQFREHVDNVRSVSIDVDGMEAALNDLNKLKNLLAGIPTASLVQFREHADKVRGIHTDIEAILNKLENIPPGITTTTTTTRGDVSSTSSRQPTLFMESTCHVGIDAAMNKLENLLDLCGEEKLKVVSIVGVGGVGKTTLANKLYRKLRWQFECRAFVRTSQKTDMRRLLINILLQIRSHQSPDNWKVHSLISSIRTYLQDKRGCVCCLLSLISALATIRPHLAKDIPPIKGFLIVIDDLWATSTWDIIKCALPEGNKSSRILTTTEIEDLALQSCSYDLKFIFKMIPFGEDDSRKLLFSIVFGSHSKCPPEVSETLYDIVRKCGGLPLAIVTVASLLASQLDKLEQWDYINKSLGYSLMANPTLEGMKQLLNLCYNNLPQHLKACMLYLSMYQGDHIIWKDDLVNQWIAEGFICATEEHDKEEISRGYFDELVGRKIIQPVHIDDSGEVLSCVVHHIVLNFVTYKSIEENFIIAIDHSQATIRFADKVRRLSIHFNNVEDAPPPTNMRLFQVRTIAFFGVLKYMPFIMEFRLIKVLFLHFLGDEDSTGIVDLTKISELVRLRYLKVTSNATVKLPTRLQGLPYLETLKIDGKISEVPTDIYLFASCNSAENLWSLGELSNLRDLQLTYSEIHSDNLKDNMKYLGSILGKLRNLTSITLSPPGSSCPDTLHIDRDTKRRINVDGWSSVSSPPALLQRFELLPCVCVFSNLPNWIGQLGNLCILKIGIREVTSNNIDVLGVLPHKSVDGRETLRRIRVKVSSTVEDGFSWVKYGQKDILGTMYPRSYFRCIHRHTKGCLATKQVQPTDDDHQILDVIYYGEHTCDQSARSDDRQLKSSRPAASSNLQEPQQPGLEQSRPAAKRRRKTVRWKTQVRVSSVQDVGPLDDGYSWRRYGLKDILGAKYPRSYFRCTHRNTQGCVATKQIQRRDGDPLLFDVVYHGDHTCSERASLNEQVTWPRSSASSTEQSSTITYTAAAGSVEDDEEGVTSATNFLSMDDMLDLGGGDVIDMDFPSFDFDAIDAFLLG
uniref:WRKY transcription factor 41 n=1 Tax=Oryza sativa subsp. indica TaxID=39946 RepID=Q6IEP0_ORYSI|nr:TPA_inf: WRKY transcription factor 41 [Oryza sativa Indica Group]